MRRSVQSDPVIPPAPAAGKFHGRHHLHHRDAEALQPRQLSCRRIEAAFPGEGAGMDLIDHLPLHAKPAPAGIAPPVGLRIDDHGGAMGALRLKPGTGIRVAALPIDAVPIQGSRPNAFEHTPKISSRLPRQGNDPLPALFNRDFHPAALRRPDMEQHSAVTDRAHRRADAGARRGGVSRRSSCRIAVEIGGEASTGRGQPRDGCGQPERRSG